MIKLNSKAKGVNMNKNLKISLDKYLANTGVIYIKMHNLHWNVCGLNFQSVHEYLETVYDGFSDVLDEVAEAIKMQGEYPLASLKEYLEVTTIEEIPSKDYKVTEVLNIVLGDLRILKAQSMEIRSLASEEDDYAIVSMMEGHLSNYDKTLWFIESMVK